MAAASSSSAAATAAVPAKVSAPSKWTMAAGLNVLHKAHNATEVCENDAFPPHDYAAAIWADAWSVLRHQAESPQMVAEEALQVALFGEFNMSEWCVVNGIYDSAYDVIVQQLTRTSDDDDDDTTLVEEIFSPVDLAMLDVRSNALPHTYVRNEFIKFIGRNPPDRIEFHPFWILRYAWDKQFGESSGKAEDAKAHLLGQIKTLDPANLSDDWIKGHHLQDIPKAALQRYVSILHPTSEQKLTRSRLLDTQSLWLAFADHFMANMNVDLVRTQRALFAQCSLLPLEWLPSAARGDRDHAESKEEEEDVESVDPSIVIKQFADDTKSFATRVAEGALLRGMCGSILERFPASSSASSSASSKNDGDLRDVSDLTWWMLALVYPIKNAESFFAELVVKGLGFAPSDANRALVMEQFERVMEVIRSDDVSHVSGAAPPTANVATLASSGTTSTPIVIDSESDDAGTDVDVENRTTDPTPTVPPPPTSKPPKKRTAPTADADVTAKKSKLTAKMTKEEKAAEKAAKEAKAATEKAAKEATVAAEKAAKDEAKKKIVTAESKFDDAKTAFSAAHTPFKAAASALMAAHKNAEKAKTKVEVETTKLNQKTTAKAQEAVTNAITAMEASELAVKRATLVREAAMPLAVKARSELVDALNALNALLIASGRKTKDLPAAANDSLYVATTASATPTSLAASSTAVPGASSATASAHPQADAEAAAPVASAPTQAASTPAFAAPVATIAPTPRPKRKIVPQTVVDPAISKVIANVDTPMAAPKAAPTEPASKPGVVPPSSGAGVGSATTANPDTTMTTMPEAPPEDSASKRHKSTNIIKPPSTSGQDVFPLSLSGQTTPPALPPPIPEWSFFDMTRDETVDIEARIQANNSAVIGLYANLLAANVTPAMKSKMETIQLVQNLAHKESPSASLKVTAEVLPNRDASAIEKIRDVHSSTRRIRAYDLIVIWLGLRERNFKIEFTEKEMITDVLARCEQSLVDRSAGELAAVELIRASICWWIRSFPVVIHRDRLLPDGPFKFFVNTNETLRRALRLMVVDLYRVIGKEQKALIPDTNARNELLAGILKSQSD